MTATLGFNAGLNTTTTQLGIIREAVWGVTPDGTAVQKIRSMGETLKKTKNKARADEIDGSGSAGDMVTQSISTGGDINFGFSALNFEEFLLGAINSYNEWPAPVNPLGTDTVYISDDVNFYSWTIVKDFGNGIINTYPGSYVTGLSLSMGQGQFITGKATVLCADEVIDQATNGAAIANREYVAAIGTGRIASGTDQFGGCYVNDVAIPAVVDAITLNLVKTNASLEFGLGSEAAAGINPGTLTVSGTLSMFFRDYTIYQYFKDDTLFKFSFSIATPLAIYTFNLWATTVNNPGVNAGGKGQPVKASFDFDCQKSPTGSPQTIQIARAKGLG